MKLLFDDRAEVADLGNIEIHRRRPDDTVGALTRAVPTE